MILKSLTLRHILTYYGDQALDFPQSKSASLTVIVGPNNSGKTSVIRALKFWFYGEAGLPKKADLPLLLSNRAKAETPVGQSLIGWVEVTFQRLEETIILRRTIEAKRLSQDRWDVREVRLEHSPGGRLPKYFRDNEGYYQRMLEGMVPRVLFDAFYFKGEPLDGKLLGDVTSIRSALGQFLHEDQWDEAEKAAGSIRKSLARQLENLSRANQELANKLKEESQNSNRLSEQRGALTKEEADFQACQQEYDRETENLSKLGDQETAVQAKAELDSASKRLSTAQSALEQADREIQREIAQSQGLPYLVAEVASVREILSGMERENILPADISEGFIDRVLARDSCICGKNHDADSRATWEAYRQKTLAADANEGLRKLLDWVKPSGALSIEQQSSRTQTALRNLLSRRSAAVRDLSEARAARTNAENRLASLPHEEIARIGNALKKLRSKLNEHSRRLRIIETNVKATEDRSRRLKGEIAEIQKKSGVDQAQFTKLSDARDRAERLETALHLCRGKLGQYFHAVLQKSVGEFYDSRATDGSRALIDRTTLLPSIRVQGQRTQNLGGGQSQLLALAYVVSLARLRQDMHTQMEALGVRLGKIDDLSFFMDSPFGNMEAHYKKAAVRLIPESARQIVLLLWKEEWEFVMPLLEDSMNAIFAIRFITRQSDVYKLTKEACTYRFPSGPVQLIQPLPEGEDQPRSEFIKLS